MQTDGTMKRHSRRSVLRPWLGVLAAVEPLPWLRPGWFVVAGDFHISQTTGSSTATSPMPAGLAESLATVFLPRVQVAKRQKHRKPPSHKGPVLAELEISDPKICSWPGPTVAQVETVSLLGGRIARWP